MRYPCLFARFWYDFIVGDSILLAIGVLVTVVITSGAEKQHVGILAQALLPAAVVVTLLASLPLRSGRAFRRV